MIISGGVNIYPQEAENVLVTHPKVIDVAVFGVPNEDFGEEVKAVVQPAEMPADDEDGSYGEAVARAIGADPALQALRDRLEQFCREEAEHKRDASRRLPWAASSKAFIR